MIEKYQDEIMYLLICYEPVFIFFLVFTAVMVIRRIGDFLYEQ